MTTIHYNHNWVDTYQKIPEVDSIEIGGTIDAIIVDEPQYSSVDIEDMEITVDIFLCDDVTTNKEKEENIKKMVLDLINEDSLLKDGYLLFDDGYEEIVQDFDFSPKLDMEDIEFNIIYGENTTNTDDIDFYVHIVDKK